MTGSSVVESAARDTQAELSAENEPSNSSFFSISSIIPGPVDLDEFRQMQTAIGELKKEIHELREKNQKLEEKVEQIRLPGPQTSDQCLSSNTTDEAEEYEGDDCVTPLSSITSKVPHDKHDWPKPVISSINTPPDEKEPSISLQNQCSLTRPPGDNVRILKIYEKYICQLRKQISCIDSQDLEKKDLELQKQKQIHEKELESLENDQRKEIDRQDGAAQLITLIEKLKAEIKSFSNVSIEKYKIKQVKLNFLSCLQVEWEKREDRPLSPGNRKHLVDTVASRPEFVENMHRITAGKFSRTCSLIQDFGYQASKIDKLIWQLSHELRANNKKLTSLPRGCFFSCTNPNALKNETAIKQDKLDFLMALKKNYNGDYFDLRLKERKKYLEDVLKSDEFRDKLNNITAGRNSRTYNLMLELGYEEQIKETPSVWFSCLPVMNRA